MKKSEVKEAMIDLVDETIMEAIFDDLELETSQEVGYAMKHIINRMKQRLEWLQEEELDELKG
jgi:hypothetical protein